MKTRHRQTGQVRPLVASTLTTNFSGSSPVATSMMSQLRKCDSGASLVEFAVVLPFLALLLIGLIDFGRYMYAGIVIANAARAAVQYGAQTPETAADTTGMKNAAIADAGGLPNVSASPLPYCLVNGVSGSCSTAGAVTYIKVVTSGTYTPLIRYPGLPASVPVSGSAVMRVESE
ncbi:MAG TPA: TadE/TadG family type IV pilus assembly protein [Candidatus Cybelea sp.]